jgi:folate-binding protein YgfZ
MTATELTDRLAAQAKRISEYRGAQTAAAYSDPGTEFSALRSSCGVYDLGWRAKLVLTGSDRVRWLNGMITNNVRDLPVGRGVYGFVLSPQGRILGDLHAYNRGDSLLVDTDQGQIPKLVELFDRYIIMDDVEATNVSDKLTALGVAGPNATRVLRTLSVDLPELQPLQFADVTYQKIGFTVVRSDLPTVDAYEIWVSPSNVNTIWDALVRAGATPAGSDAIELLRIASGIPHYGVDIRERDLPQETEQDRALNFTKGCYIGQEIVERIRSRGNVHRTFAGMIIDGDLPSAGTKIESEGKEVGEITSAASLPTSSGERRVALGYVRRETGTPEKKIRVAGGDALITALPFAEVFKN